MTFSWDYGWARKALNAWHRFRYPRSGRWFAWRPVAVGFQITWLETVWRSSWSEHGRWNKTYITLRAHDYYEAEREKWNKEQAALRAHRRAINATVDLSKLTNQQLEDLEALRIARGGLTT